MIQLTKKFVPSYTRSTSQLSAASRCLTMWSNRYLHGIAEPGEVKRASVLGLVIHACVESHYNGGSIYQPVLDGRTQRDVGLLTYGKPTAIKELLTFAASRAISGLPHLPNKDLMRVVQVEQPLQFNPTPSEGPPVEMRGLLDLVVQRPNGTWLLIDHKSTKGRAWSGTPYPAELGRPLARKIDRRAAPRYGGPWAYAKTAEEMPQDPQANFYGYSVMVEHGLTELDCRWIYYGTDPKLKPMSIAVDFRLEMSQVMRTLWPWLELAQLLHNWTAHTQAQGPPPSELTGYPELLLPNRESPCAAFGGCQYHTTRAGTCAPEGDLADRLTQFAIGSTC